tara:strand:+ start:157 stop:1125 length:969 start_codon:yes stop_codon:yes gene_type:complete
MNGGAFKFIWILLLGFSSVIRAADDPVLAPLLSTNSMVIIVPTNGPTIGVLPIVEGRTNAILSAEEEHEKKVAEARKTWKATTNNLGIYHVIPEKDPFRLNSPKMEKPGPKILGTTAVGVPHLAGISKLRNKIRAVLRINPAKGGSAEYKFIEAGEMVDDVKVLKIDSKGGTVEIMVKGQTFTLELDKKVVAGSKHSVRPSGPRYRPGDSSGSLPRASSSKGVVKQREAKGETGKGGGSQKSTKRPSGSGRGGLGRVPRRGDGDQGSLRTIRPIGADLYELPAFNEIVQKRIIDPLNISTQREIIRGQLLYEPPTDLPRDKR